MKEYKEGVPFVVNMTDGTKKNVMFKRSNDINCRNCVFYNEGYSICSSVRCIDYERKDGLNGYYVYVDSAEELARKYLGKEINYKGHKGMVVGYNQDDIILSFSDGCGWDNIGDNRHDKLLIHSKLNKGFAYVNKNIL